MGGCLGGEPATAAKFIAEQGGLPTDASYPYDSVSGAACLPRTGPNVTLSGHGFIPQNVTAMEAAVSTYGAVVGVINVLPDFIFYSSGVYSNPACTPTLQHAVT